MMTDMTWNEFCELYYSIAKKDAEINLHKQIGKNGDTNKRVDRNYVIDAAVLAALEKTYTHFDASRGAKITTYLSRVVHNEVVDEFVRESKAAARQDDIDDQGLFGRHLARGERRTNRTLTNSHRQAFP